MYACRTASRIRPRLATFLRDWETVLGAADGGCVPSRVELGSTMSRNQKDGLFQAGTMGSLLCGARLENIDE